MSGMRSNLLWLLGVLGALTVSWVLETHLLTPYYLRVLQDGVINVSLAVSLNLLNGFTGQFSMGHAGFMAIGAYMGAFLSTTLLSMGAFTMGSGAEPLVLLGVTLSAGLIATLAGYAVGLPSLRLRGDYLAIVTLGFGEIIRVVLLNIDAVGGARGFPGVPKLTHLSSSVLLAMFTLFVVSRLLKGRLGREWIAVREDEVAAEAMGVPTTQAKVRAFAIGAFFAGAAGCLFAHHLSYIAPQQFDYNKSFEIIIMVVLGGMGSITGSVVAALGLTFLREGLRPLQEWTQLDFRMVIYSLALIVLMLTRPKGLFGTKELSSYFKRKTQKEVST